MAEQSSTQEAQQSTPNKSPISLTDALDGQKLKPTISLFRMMIENQYGDRLRQNVMTGKPEYYDRLSKSWREWDDVNDAQMRAWFQNNYGLYHEKMLRDALQIHFKSHEVNPLINLLESLSWDEKPRIASAWSVYARSATP